MLYRFFELKFVYLNVIYNLFNSGGNILFNFSFVLG
jgi:hypothetical protein